MNDVKYYFCIYDGNTASNTNVYGNLITIVEDELVAKTLCSIHDGWHYTRDVASLAKVLPNIHEIDDDEWFNSNLFKLRKTATKNLKNSVIRLYLDIKDNKKYNTDEKRYKLATTICARIRQLMSQSYPKSLTLSQIKIEYKDINADFDLIEDDNVNSDSFVLTSINAISFSDEKNVKFK